MPVRLREYHRPEDWATALSLLSRVEMHTAPLVIGPRPRALSDLGAEAAVDLSRLDLAYVTESDNALNIGVLTSLEELAQAPRLQAYAGGILARAARLAAHPGLRHLSTVAGALLARDGPPEVLLALLALGATVVTRSSADRMREAPLADFLAAGSKLSSDEWLVEVNVASTRGAPVGGALERVARTPRDEAIFAAAAVVEAADGVCRRARLAVGPRLQPVAAIEQILEGHAITRESLQAAAEVVTAKVDPIADFRASARYRRAMAGVLARRALTAAWQQATG